MLIVALNQSRALLIQTSPAEFEQLIEQARERRAILTTIEEAPQSRPVPLASVLPRVSQ